MCKRNKWLSRAGAALCAVLMLTAFSGCNGNGGDAGDQIITPSTDSTGEATDAVTEPTEAPTEAETTTTTAAPVTSDVGYVNAQFIQGSPVTVTTTAPADDIPTPTTASVPQE